MRHRSERRLRQGRNWATYFGGAPLVALLVSQGADLTRVGQTDEQPIEIAIREGHAEVVKILATAGARPRPGKDKPPLPAREEERSSMSPLKEGGP